MIHMIENSFARSTSSPFSLVSPCRPMVSGKRARSPEENIEERVTKRPSLAIDAFNRRQLSNSSASSSRQGSEDWVKRAGGLSIDSPIYTHADPDHLLLQAEETSNSGPEEEDMHMLIDSEGNAENATELQEAMKPQLVALNALSLNSYLVGKSYEQLPPHAQGGPHTEPRTSSYSERLQSTVMPAINVLPATPTDDVPIHRQYLDHLTTHAVAASTIDLFSNSRGNASLAPPTEHTASPYVHAMPTPKRRIAFGPRASCEKCRLGVPGHFIHYD